MTDSHPEWVHRFSVVTHSGLWRMRGHVLRPWGTDHHGVPPTPSQESSGRGPCWRQRTRWRSSRPTTTRASVHAGADGLREWQPDTWSTFSPGVTWTHTKGSVPSGKRWVARRSQPPPGTPEALPRGYRAVRGVLRLAADRSVWRSVSGSASRPPSADVGGRRRARRCVQGRRSWRRSTDTCWRSVAPAVSELRLRLGRHRSCNRWPAHSRQRRRSHPKTQDGHRPKAVPIRLNGVD